MILNLFLAFTLQFGGGACGCEDQPQVNTLAVVNGTKITKQQLGTDAQNRITQLQAEVIKAREAALELEINRLLLEAEAKRRGITPEQLLQLEVIDKVPQPTEAEVQALYNESKKHIRGDFKTVRPQIIALIRAENERLEVLRFAGALRSAANLVVVNPNVTPPANEEELDRVFVTVNGRRITSRDIEESLLALIFRVQQQVYEVRKQDLDLRINGLLLEQEAKTRNTTPEALLASEVRSKLPIITDQQARSFYEENKARIREDFDKVKYLVIQYLLAQEEQKLSTTYANRLRENAAVQIYLAPPESPTFRIATDNQPTRGNAKASVTVVEFTDFECTACAQEYAEFEKLVAEFGSQVKFVVRDYPLDQHKFAGKAAEAAEAAREQGKYWEYVSLLYSNQATLRVDDLKKFAAQLGLDRTKFDTALDSGLFRPRIQRDIVDGAKLAIENVPTFFVNGKRVTDYSYAGLRAAIVAALK
jgi:protein-disulfide isomerase